MGTWLVVALLLSQEPPLEEVPTPTPELEEPGPTARILGSLGFGGLAAGLTTGAFVFIGRCRGPGSDCLILGITAATLGLAGIIAGAYGGHRLFGGRSSAGWTILGATTGALVGFVGLYGFSTGTGNPSFQPFIGVLPCAAVAAIGAMAMLEVGHALWVREQPVRVALAPLLVPNGGAGLAVGGAF